MALIAIVHLLMMRRYFKQYVNEGTDRENGREEAGTSIISKISRKHNLPTIPQVYIKLIQTLNSGEYSAHEISGLIKSDPALSFTIMDMAYSTGKRVNKPTMNLESAVAAIGVDVIKGLVLCASTNAVFDSGTVNRSFKLMMFWEHSLRCAYLAQLISEELNYNYYEEAYLIGLLHDLGKLILLNNFYDKYNNLLISNHDSDEIVLSENKAIGIDHCKTAALLIDQWDFHSFGADAIFYHHHPLEAVINATPLVRVIYVANLLAQKTHDNGKKYQAAEKLFGFSRDRSDRYITESETKLRETINFLGIEDMSHEYSQDDFEYKPGNVGTLANEVRDASIISGALQNLNEAENRTALLKAVKQGLQAMIGLSDIALFLYNYDEEALIFHNDGTDDYSAILEDLYISVHLEKSILVSSLLNKEPLDSFSYSEHSELAILDAQIIHFLDKEGIICLPMLKKSEFIGVIVLGIDRNELSYLSEQERLLEMFIHQISSILYADQLRHDRLNRYHSDRLESSVLRARKIVHEINNPLSIIKNYLKVLGMRLTENNIAHEEILIVNEEINRIGIMLRTLAGPKNKNVGAKEPVDVNLLISDLVKLTNGSFTGQYDIEIHLDTDPLMPVAVIQKDSLKQIILNLLKNAMEAMPQGGNIFIKTLYTPNPVKDGPKPVESRSPGLLEISITDDGPGIPDDARRRLFDPFVTSRDGHDGLGLSIVSDLVNRMNGSIACESDEGKGTSFKIRLPLRVD